LTSLHRAAFRLPAVGLLTVAALSIAMPARAAEAPLQPDAVVVVQGHGWGHGRGMGQWGAKGQADAGRSWSTIVTSYYSGVTIGTRSPTEDIRILLETSADVVVTSDAAFSVRWVGGGTFVASDETYRFFRARHDGTSYIVEKGPAASGPWTFVDKNTLPVRFQPGTTLLQHIENGGIVRYYRGLIDAFRTGTTSLRSINDVTMQGYLYGAVPREMPATWAPEAVRAQSVAARSYATYKRDNARAAGDPYDICATTSCQVYLGVAYRSSVAATTVVPLEHPSATAAVDATAGKVLFSGGKPILAEYSSSSGGYTAAGSVPYLAAVPDPWDSISPYHHWDAKIAGSAIESKWAEIGDLIRVDVTKRNGYGDYGGRVLEMKIVGTVKAVTITGDAFRSAFSWPSSGDVKSNWFRVLFWRGELASAPAKPAVVSGGSTTLPIFMRNTGNTVWPVGGVIRLATESPSKFAGPGWISTTRPSSVSANASVPGKSTVAPNEVARFDVGLNAGVVPPGLYFEKLRLVYDGLGPVSGWFTLEVPVVRGIVGFVRGNTWHFHSGGIADKVSSFGSSGDLPVVGDWDGDGIDTPGVVKGNVWYLNDGLDPNAEHVFAYGSSGDKPVVGDWNGDGIDTPGVVKGNVWYLNEGLDPNAEHVFAFGSSGDVPMVGDWNGDGIDTPGVVKGNVWYLNEGLDPNAEHVFAYGSVGDKPVVGDWNGNGTDTPGVVKGATWFLNNGFDPSAEVTFTYGLSTDTPIVGDWDGPPLATPGLVEGNVWRINMSFDSIAEAAVGYGSVGDKQVVGDWDGDGLDTPGVIKGNVWYLNNGFDPNGDVTFGYGTSTATPVTGDWNGDGKDTAGVVQGSTWLLTDGSGPFADVQFEFGSGTGVPIAGDWDGDGVSTPGIVVGNTWTLNNGFDSVAEIVFEFGSADGTPVVGDWDGDGVDEPGMVIGGTWHLNEGFDGTAEIVFAFGDGSEKPIAGRWVN
jgi:SpoIID/LytB domain protein